jgi:hypothetical protein
MNRRWNSAHPAWNATFWVNSVFWALLDAIGVCSGLSRCLGMISDFFGFPWLLVDLFDFWLILGDFLLISLFLDDFFDFFVMLLISAWFSWFGAGLWLGCGWLWTGVWWFREGSNSWIGVEIQHIQPEMQHFELTRFFEHSLMLLGSVRGYPDAWAWFQIFSDFLDCLLIYLISGWFWEISCWFLCFLMTSLISLWCCWFLHGLVDLEQDFG